MKQVLEFVKTTVVGGLVVVLPMAAAVLIAVKMLAALEGAVDPVAAALPFGTHVGRLLALLIILAGCFVTGLLVRTSVGRRANVWLEQRVLERLPAYSLLRNLGRQVAGDGDDSRMAPALAEIEEALVPAFIVEQLDDGRFTVFVPAIPTPTVGAVYILTPERVHRLDVPITQLVQVVTRWGLGLKELVAAAK
ncbi:MAG TPA: hypothetical protein VL049_11045 [Candidatus Dormibacteraeota bacterium]|nr:hypothetical protein [Candidatus Dormibacteraeota bacterium]